MAKKSVTEGLTQMAMGSLLTTASVAAGAEATSAAVATKLAVMENELDRDVEVNNFNTYSSFLNECMLGERLECILGALECAHMG